MDELSLHSLNDCILEAQRWSTILPEQARSGRTGGRGIGRRAHCAGYSGIVERVRLDALTMVDRRKGRHTVGEADSVRENVTSPVGWQSQRAL